MAGLVTGVSRMGVHFAYPTPKCGGTEPDVRPAVLTEVHYLHFAIINAAVTLVVDVVISLVTKPRRKEQVKQLGPASYNIYTNLLGISTCT